MNEETKISDLNVSGEFIVVKTVAGDIKCEKAILSNWHIIEDKKTQIQFSAKTYEHCMEGIQKFYSQEIGREPGDAKYVLFTKKGILEYPDTPVYMIVKYRDPKTGEISVTQVRDFRLEFELLDEDELEVVERVHYSENTLHESLKSWSEKLGLPINKSKFKIVSEEKNKPLKSGLQ